MNTIPHRQIAESLNVTRQHVSSMVKRGLPTTSIEAAKSWYDRNVQSRYSRGRWRRFSSPEADPSPVEFEELDFDLVEQDYTLAPLQLTPHHYKDIVPDTEIEAWFDREVGSVEEAAEVGAILLQMLRCYIDEMPHVMAERCNPLEPERARQELQHWVETFDRHCFTEEAN